MTITYKDGIPVPANAVILRIEPKRTLAEAKKHAETVWGKK